MRGDDDAERVGIGEGGAQDLVGLDLLHMPKENPAAMVGASALCHRRKRMDAGRVGRMPFSGAFHRPPADTAWSVGCKGIKAVHTARRPLGLF